MACGRIYYFEDPPIVCREVGKNGEEDISLGINEKAIQAFLRNIQKELSDKIFEIGEDKPEHKTKTVSKAVEEYQEHFVYVK